MNRRDFLRKSFKVGGISALVSLGVDYFAASKMARAWSPTNLFYGDQSTPTYTVSYIDSTTNYAASASSVVVTAPVTPQDGDLMLAAFSCEVSTANLSSTSGFSAFTPALYENASGAVRTEMFYKIASSESGSYTFNTDAAGNLVCDILLFRKTGGTWNYSVDNDGDSAYSTTLTTTGVNTVDNSILMVTFFSSSGSATLDTPPSGMTQAEGTVNAALRQHSYYQAYSAASGVTKSITYSADSTLNGLAVVVYAE